MVVAKFLVGRSVPLIADVEVRGNFAAREGSGEKRFYAVGPRSVVVKFIAGGNADVGYEGQTRAGLGQ